MKKLFIIGITLLILLFTLANCEGLHGDSTETSETSPASEETEERKTVATDKNEIFYTPLEDSIEFTSPENLIDAYKLVKAGEADSDWTRIAESVDFMELEKFYLPTGIPKPYQLYQISIMKAGIHIKYYREEDLASAGANPSALIDCEYFSFFYSHDSSMQQYDPTEQILIDGKYLLSGEILYWALDGGVMSLKLPVSPDVYARKISVVDYLGLSSVDELVKFTELKTINLPA